MTRSIAMAMVGAVLAAFPIAAVVALGFRFPIPFSGYESGPMAAVRSLLAVVFYGLAGGFVVLAALGAACVAVGQRLAGPDVGKQRRLTIALILVGDSVAVLVLAVLDRIIGPW